MKKIWYEKTILLNTVYKNLKRFFEEHNDKYDFSVYDKGSVYNNTIFMKFNGCFFRINGIFDVDGSEIQFRKSYRKKSNQMIIIYGGNLQASININNINKIEILNGFDCNIIENIIFEKDD